MPLATGCAVSKTWALPDISDDELLELEDAILKAFDTRSTDGLTIFGLGELGIAVGWPSEAPRAVLKRQAPGPVAQLDDDMARMQEFYDALIAAGAPVIPTDIRVITNPHGVKIPYLIQPIIDRDDLAENIIAAGTPSTDDPILVSLRDTVARVVRDDASGGLSIDAQVTNFAWDGEQVISLDTTPPLIWKANSGPMYEVGNYLTAVPMAMRPIAIALTKKNGDDYRTVRGVLKQTAVYLLRIEQDRWLDSAIVCFNEVLDEPLTRPEVEKKFRDVQRDLPTIKRLARAQRFWATKVRKQRYEFFITNSFTGEIY